ncbi:DASH complex subunit ask1 [Pseudocyphellaria aurata]|nr:DASH complex subunit ask1 [Pseudocyphellaria aurata]
MSRANLPSSQRNLTLTEELEKLEQSITLTLQEIDHNFSRAHRIVTTSILPVVEKYAEHSKDVWEGSKFWKQFFEASANVSLSSYEEPQDPPANDETATEENTQTTPSSSAYGSPSSRQDETITPNSSTVHPRTNDDSTITSTSSQVTPRAPTTAKKPPTIAPYSSPYEALKREVRGVPSQLQTDEPSSLTLPSTPRTQQQSPDLQSSPFLPPTSQQPFHRTPANDVLLHRILDKNWRLQATPHSQPHAPRMLPYRGGGKTTETPQPSARRRATHGRANDPGSPDSSPPAPAPELHAEIFDSPVRRPRVPGVSILTPARNRDNAGGKSRSVFEGEDVDRGRRKMADIWDSDSDEERGVEGLSPPKTMQFHVPQSRLLRTPGTSYVAFHINCEFVWIKFAAHSNGLTRRTFATPPSIIERSFTLIIRANIPIAREASKRIVEDLLLTAGGNVTDDLDEDSPSVIKRGGLLDEDTF